MKKKKKKDKWDSCVSTVMKTKYSCLFPPACFRDIFTFEIYLMSERVFLFGAETAYSQRKWTWAIAKVILIIIFSS